MPAIVKELTIATTPERIYNALTLQDQIVLWWANEASLKPEVGSLAEMRFKPPAGTLKFEIAGLKTGEQVRWISRQGPPQWLGTGVIWQLTTIQDGTRLRFTHEGFAQIDEVYNQTSTNWEYFLESLKSYLEKGKGTPGFPVFV